MEGTPNSGTICTCIMLSKLLI
uniref:Uncharacterized protein n=1 Tax=Rhizophora mucronata TaxID=61149 RepID=A0A2P2Q9J0_RHIMU